MNEHVNPIFAEVLNRFFAERTSDPYIDPAYRSELEDVRDDIINAAQEAQ